MSQSEVDRFVADLKDNADLRGKLRDEASGVASVVSFAQDQGYDITTEEARDYIHAQSNRELSDADLEAIAGGKSHHHHHHHHVTSSVTQVLSVQTAVTATTEATTAETTAEVAAEATAVVAAT